MITLDFVKNKTYYVVGLGQSNTSAIKALKKSGADVRVWDDNADNLKGYDDNTIRPPEKAPWSKIKAVVTAPGIPPSHESIQTANEKSVPVICDIDLYAQSNPKSKIIGITGTNGKSTVTALTHHILNGDGKAQMGGNIGVPVMDLKTRMDYTVLELSSYQLDRAPNLACDVACLLNITPDHLNWHGDMDHYVSVKAKIFDGADTKVISIDDDYSKSIFEGHDHAKPLSIYAEDLPFGKHDFPKMKGPHNFQNCLAAYSICRALDIDHDVIMDRMKSFEGLNHRQFLVKTINGIPYINDSKATNVEATKMALQSYNNIIWIAGGQAKDGGLDGIDDMLSSFQKAYLYGACADEFAAFLSVRGVEVQTCLTMDEAVAMAHKHAQDLRGEPSGSPTVLLSPAAASFDQFDNFEQRGDHFADLVMGLGDD
jgi:UDP-N-acetylmuramoylalanine--D-glutamate ligase